MVVVVVVVVVEVEVVWLLKIFLVLLEQNKNHTLNDYLGFCRPPFDCSNENKTFNFFKY